MRDVHVHLTGFASPIDAWVFWCTAVAVGVDIAARTVRWIRERRRA